ncbi:hypothetical protein [uncultured Clostridium sp.]|nr:hypothetical protein [uncultured Clostridium sp.]
MLGKSNNNKLVFDTLDKDIGKTTFNNRKKYYAKLITQRRFSN